jgi:hypothetical protein
MTVVEDAGGSRVIDLLVETCRPRMHECFIGQVWRRKGVLSPGHAQGQAQGLPKWGELLVVVILRGLKGKFGPL